MQAYRLYFRAGGSIVARQDFEAEDDTAAQRIAVALFDACSDSCQRIDLWQGTRHIAVDLPGRGGGLGSLSDAHQETVVRTEEMIVRSEWAIAASRRLIAELDRAKRRNIG
jgi:hypothetical protein